MKALITGVTGQTGSFLAEYLVDKGYDVYGLDRRKSVQNHANLKNIKDRINIVEGDLTDPFSINKIIKDGKFDEVYNLGAQSHVHVSFEQPVLTYQINTFGVLNLLEAIREHSNHTRFVTANTSEMFGAQKPPQSEATPFYPRSPYGVSKLAAYWMTQNYHESYKLRCSSALSFNHESARRGDNFVTKKITNWVRQYRYWDKYGNECPHVLKLGNLSAKRDWSHALDIVDGLYRICNQHMFYNGARGDKWESYVVGSGKSYSVREFIEKSLTYAFGLKTFLDRFCFRGQGLEETVFDMREKVTIIRVDPEFFRPCEVDFLQADPTKIKTELGWDPKYNLDDLIVDMIDSEEYTEYNIHDQEITANN